MGCRSRFGGQAEEGGELHDEGRGIGGKGFGNEATGARG